MASITPTDLAVFVLTFTGVILLFSALSAVTGRRVVFNAFALLVVAGFAAALACLNHRLGYLP